jgi:hypothetical protein
MNEVQYEQMQEDIGIGQWSMESLRYHFDAMNGATMEGINRAVYNATECGASVTINDNAEIVFHSIVEGSNAEFSCDPIETIEREQEEISADIVKALAWLEAECDAAFNEVHF